MRQFMKHPNYVYTTSFLPVHFFAIAMFTVVLSRSKSIAVCKQAIILSLAVERLFVTLEL